jgi:hypothetical protein
MDRSCRLSYHGVGSEAQLNAFTPNNHNCGKPTLVLEMQESGLQALSTWKENRLGQVPNPTIEFLGGLYPNVRGPHPWSSRARTRTHDGR